MGPAGAAAQFAELVAEASAAHDVLVEANSLAERGIVLAYQGHPGAARAAAEAAIDATTQIGDVHTGVAYGALAAAALAAGDVATALHAIDSWPALSALPQAAGVRCRVRAETALAGGHLLAARHRADEAVTMATGGIYLSQALTTRARVAIAQGEPEQAQRDAHDALACAAEVAAYSYVPETFACLAVLATRDGSPREAARLLGAAHVMRERMGLVRFKIYDAYYEAMAASLREALGEKGFEVFRAEGAALSTQQAIAYAQRGRGERKRPTSGWAALTPTELDVVRLVSEGLGNKDIATRLFVSPRTVQTHLTHVYTKLGLTSRVQLAQEAARHA